MMTIFLQGYREIASSFRRLLKSKILTSHKIQNVFSSDKMSIFYPFNLHYQKFMLYTTNCRRKYHLAVMEVDI